MTEIYHYGTPKKSGRYPWGSGSEPYQSAQSFLSMVADLKNSGLSETEIAKGLGMTTSKLRTFRSVARNEKRAADVSQVRIMKDKGLSNSAIGKKMGINESTVRSLLDPTRERRNDVLMNTTSMLRETVGDSDLVDIGAGSERYMGVSREKLNAAVSVLKAEGYSVNYLKVQQLGTKNDTTVKVLAPPGVTYSDVYKNRENVKLANHYTDDGGRTYHKVGPPLSVAENRVAINYAEQGGDKSDGLMLIRPGVSDLSMGGSRYAQVRIKVGEDRYLKGMAIYSNDLPPGKDIVFNTNKSREVGMRDVLKPMSDDPDLPFGAIVRPIQKRDANGKEVTTSAVNIVNEEGSWNEWSKNLSSQMLSKQTPALAKQQLDLTYNTKRAEYEEIMSLTNPVVKKKLLDSFADDADSSSVKLKAAAMPRQRTQVILPINSMRDTEIYAPNFNNGDRVALIRYPHGGKFEIPELTVNNRNKEARAAMGNSSKVDAVGINSNVAKRLSGADFDGDTVVVIPNPSGAVKTSLPLQGLKNFDPQTAYPGYPGMRVMSDTQKQMGSVSNLITDMTIEGATNNELARAVRHSMVVIDAKKHKLNYKQSAEDNQIAALKERYQGGATSGASTLISRASSEERINVRKPRPAAEGGPIDLATGRRVYVDAGYEYVDGKGATQQRKEKVARAALTNDARTLSSGTRMEGVYANHSNRLKALANTARKASIETKLNPYSPSARKVYHAEVATLKASLNTALMNAPLERKAQLLGNAIVAQKRKAHPDMEKSELKKVKSIALDDARSRVGANKKKIKITPKEWTAIQAGAISPKMLRDILDNTDLATVKEYATPREKPAMTTARAARARSMLAAGYTMAEVSGALGVPVSTISNALN